MRVLRQCISLFRKQKSHLSNHLQGLRYDNPFQNKQIAWEYDLKDLAVEHTKWAN